MAAHLEKYHPRTQNLKKAEAEYHQSKLSGAQLNHIIRTMSSRKSYSNYIYSDKTAS